MVTIEEIQKTIQHFKDYLEESKLLIEKYIKETEELLNEFDHAN